MRFEFALDIVPNFEFSLMLIREHVFVCISHRLTIHMDEELRGLAFTTLQALMVDFCDWREDVLSGFVYFIVREVTDVHPTLLDNAVKMLLQLIIQWRQAVQSSNRSQDCQVCVCPCSHWGSSSVLRVKYKM